MADGYDPRADALQSYEAGVDALRAKHLNARKVVRIGDCELILGDCLEVMPLLGADCDAVTDPPYGIGQDKGFVGFGGFGGFGTPIARKQYAGGWDGEVPTKKLFEVLLASCSTAIIFGGNYFTDRLPVGRHWLVWDKLNTMPSFSDCELAWTNIAKKSVKRLRYEYNGILGKREDRVHPTQKPVDVMRWAVEQTKRMTILDPFMGSGTTGVACVQLDRKFIGIELDEDYFNIACERIAEAYKQPKLFSVERPKPPVNGNLFDE